MAMILHCKTCFYESEIVKRREQRQSSQIVLLQVASGILLWTNGARSRKRSVFKNTAVPSSCFEEAMGSFVKREKKNLPQASIRAGQRPDTQCCMRVRRKSFSGATPSILRFPKWETRMRNGSLTPTLREEERRLHQHLNPAGFN